MRKLLTILILSSASLLSDAQQYSFVGGPTATQKDSIRGELFRTKNDTLRMSLARGMGVHFQEINRDSSLFYHQLQLDMARKLGQKLWQADALEQMGWVLSQLKNYPLSLTCFLEAISIVEDPASEKNIHYIRLFTKDDDPRNARLGLLGFIHNDIAMLYRSTGNEGKYLSNLLTGLNIGKKNNDQNLLALINLNLAEFYQDTHVPDSVRNYGIQALQHMRSAGYNTYLGNAFYIMGRSYLHDSDYTTARTYLDSSIIANLASGTKGKISQSYLSFADLYRALGKNDSSIYYTQKAVENSFAIADAATTNLAYMSLYKLYLSMNKTDSAFTYLQKSKALTDSLNLDEKKKLDEYQNIGFNDQIQRQELEQARIQKNNTIRTYTLMAAIAIFMLIAFLLYRNNKNRKKANLLLQEQKEKIESTLSELKATQSQLIQAEKMASLGELTAGIAHEIQNPLNFVNNFSEVSKELLQEMKDSLSKGDTGEASEIADDVIQNLEKIYHHGKRADTIVKGMLQHSRTETGKKEATDINALIDEYLRLSYHGIRAKDNNFNVALETDFDPAIGNVSVIPQDIGRILLNLFNNAFYAVKENSAQMPDGYRPTISVDTKRINNKIFISVKDNGNGIPQNIIDKVFQPFFTTKPTGQGTGLGLSLTYDIIKAHGGEIKIETKEQEGTTFFITLPV